MKTYDETGALVIRGGVEGPEGPEGPAGSPGGLPGGYTLLFKFDTGTTDTGIASGELRFNDATPSSVAQIYVHQSDRDAVDISAALAALAVGEKIKIFKESDSSVFSLFEITGVTDSGAYYTLDVTFIAGSGLPSDADDIGMGIGVIGRDGPPGGYTLRYLYNTNTAAPPGASQVRFNNATPASATKMYVRKTDINSADRADELLSLDPSGTAPNRMLIFKVDDEANYLAVQITNATDQTNYVEFDITVVDSAGSWSLLDPIGLAPSWSGANGASGSQGETGVAFSAQYVYSSSTGAPSAGQIRFAIDASTINFHDTDNDANDLDTLWSFIGVGDWVQFRMASDPANQWAMISISSVTDHTTYRAFGYTIIGFSGTVPPDEVVDVTWSRQGPTGPEGDAGADGADGDDGEDGAAGANAPVYNITSGTEHTIGTGSKTFTTDPISANAYVEGSRVRITAFVDAPAGTWMEGVVTDPDPAAFTVTIDLVSGSGTWLDWSFSIAGEPGQQGEDGEDGEQGEQGPPGDDAPEGPNVKAFLLRSSNQSIPHGADTDVVWNTEVHDTDAMWSIGLPSVVTINTEGEYLILVKAWWATSATGRRRVMIWGNTSGAGYGTTIGTTEYNATDYQQCVGRFYFSAGQSFKVQVAQTSGAALNLRGGVVNDQLLTTLHVIRLSGPGPKGDTGDTGPMGEVGELKRARAKRASSQSIPASTVTSIVWTVEDSDNDAMFTAGGSTMEVKTAGYFRVYAQGTLAGVDTATSVTCYLYKNGTLVAQDVVLASGINDRPPFSVDYTCDCEVGDVFEVKLLHTSSGARNLEYNFIDTYFEVVRLGD